MPFYSNFSFFYLPKKKNAESAFADVVVLSRHLVYVFQVLLGNWPRIAF